VAHIVRDLLAGSVIVAAGTAISLAALILFLFLWVFFHIVGYLVPAALYVFLFFAAVWLIGFAYRKLKGGTG
jgi:hypothetical protein